jgi:hypothetical protein
MRKAIAIGCAVFLAVVFMASAPVLAKSAFKKGDEVYVCACDGCPCMEMAHKAGKCTCGKDMVKSKIDKISKGKATVMVNGKAQMFPITGKYVCDCGKACKCDAVSQKAGDCPCGKPMKEANAKKTKK